MNPSIHPLRSFALALSLTIAAVSSSAHAADSPAAILKDYQSRAETALEKPNKILETQAANIAASLLRAGASAEAEQVTTQMKLKAAGDPVPMPVSAAAELFKKYDTARAAALKPVQEQAIARINTLLSSSEGKKIEIITELGKVRSEVEAGKATQSLPFAAEWTYHKSLDTKALARMVFKADGTWELTDLGSPIVEAGTWKMADKKTLNLDFKGSPWKIVIDGKAATVERPDYGKRYLRVATAEGVTAMK